MAANRLTLQNYWSANGKSIFLEMQEENIRRRREQRYSQSQRFNAEYMQALIKNLGMVHHVNS